jgi:cytochrome c biogenesis protein CcmG/thiol:disulfide interchange protein DsbE
VNRWLTFLPLALLIALVAVGAVLLTRGGERASFTEGMVGRPAPAFVLERLGGGEPVRAEAMAGRPYVINLFASWCAPCRAEHPQLLALQARGVELIGVAYKDRPENTQQYLDELQNPFGAVGVDPEGRFGLELGITGVPETFVISADGRVAATYRGPLTDEVVERVILPALAP